eukprot:3762775-Alexandrium_andersonii.AAC.1
MSASLVGSEMCIRDRVVAALPGALGALLAALREAAEADDGALPEARHRGCLLYTSDAADDM